MISAPPGNHCKNRVFEWWSTAAIFSMGLLLLVWPDAFEKSKLQFMLDVVNHQTMTVAFLVIGWSRGVALYLNGRLPTWGSVIRIIASIGGASLWFQMGMSLVLVHTSTGEPPTPTIPIYFTLVCAEIYSTYRAASDVRYK